jgi:acyl carrier protein
MAGLKKLVSKALRLPADSPVSDTLTMAETRSWDSLAHMELVLAVEEHYQVNLSADEIVAMTSIAGIVAVLRARGVEPQ